MKSSHNTLLGRQLPAADHPGLGPRWRAIINLPRAVIIFISVGMLLLVASVDAVTDPDLSFAFFYLVPVVLVTWLIGRRAGYFMAVASAVTWFFVERMGAAIYHRPLIAYLNAGSRFAFFILAVVVLSAFRNLSLRLGTLVDERTATLRRLASQLSEAEDFERRRLAYDIHDGFSQILSVLKMNLEGALPETAEGVQPRQRITDAIGMVSELIDRSRTLTFDLHPAMLDHLGLVPTLRQYAEQFARRADLEVTISDDGAVQPLAPSLTHYLFRSIKELLNNAARHGKARQIVIGVYWTPITLRIVIDDDGHGFDSANLFAAATGKGLGLVGIRERLLSLGGKLWLESTVGQGTRVVLELPTGSPERSS